LKLFTIDTWFEERMVTNTESGISENRIVGTVSGLHMSVADSTHAVIETMESGAEQELSASNALLIGDVSTWIIHSETKTCQISSKPNAGKAFNLIRKYLAGLPSNYETYNWGEDSLSRMAELGTNMFPPVFFILSVADE
ncbi:MAG: hypothetical protein ACXVA9_06990, partial [Bdellovibrionales bacterium]